MRRLPKFFLFRLGFLLSFGLFVVSAQGAEPEEFNSEKIISEIEKKMDLSREKWEHRGEEQRDVGRAQRIG